MVVGPSVFVDREQLFVGGVRDSKNPAGPALVFTPGEWDAFTAGVSNGGFDRA
ncbi:DUF397 domain-containing protein [Nocardia sp. NPDC052278]|uniref:DUF397 domain-containing protein n=1 Tax=unclassified Nocardia TaxID=2637762 RepID=UPI0036C90360